MPIQRLVIVSDAHLGAAPPETETALLRFLDAVPQLGDGLLLNGDLFGFWFTYRRAVPRSGIRVLARLAALARTMPLLMTGGNHDRWGEPFWEREFGIQFGARELGFELGGRPALAIHGDGLGEPSRRTVLKQRIAGHPLVSFGFRVLPAELGFWLTDRAGRLVEPTPKRVRLAAEAAALQRSWAERRLREAAELSLLVMGHTHRAVAEELFPGQRYLNPGAWYDGQRYAVATAATMELRRFEV